MLLSDGKENYTDFQMNLIIGAIDFEVSGTNVTSSSFLHENLTGGCPMSLTNCR